MGNRPEGLIWKEEEEEEEEEEISVLLLLYVKEFFRNY
jgi:hypothetical protein